MPSESTSSSGRRIQVIKGLPDSSDSLPFGTSATPGGLVQLDANGALPAVSGANLTGISSGGSTVCKVKTANQLVTESATLVNDTDLTFTVPSGETWTYQFDLLLESTDPTTFNYQFAVTGAGVQRNSFSFVTNEATGQRIELDAMFATLDTASVATGVLHVFGYSTAGVVTVQFAQASAVANAAVVHSKGSRLVAHKIA